MNHLNAETIESLAMGISPASDEICRHLAECASCAALLEREAQLEMLLHSAAESAPARAARMVWQGGLRVAAGFLLLIGGSLWFAHAQQSVHPDSPAPRVEETLVMDPPRATMALGRDVESPRDYGRWAQPYAPGLEQGATGGPHLSDSLYTSP